MSLRQQSYIEAHKLVAVEKDGSHLTTTRARKLQTILQCLRAIPQHRKLVLGQGHASEQNAGIKRIPRQSAPKERYTRDVACRQTAWSFRIRSGRSKPNG